MIKIILTFMILIRIVLFIGVYIFNLRKKTYKHLDVQKKEYFYRYNIIYNIYIILFYCELIFIYSLCNFIVKFLEDSGIIVLEKPVKKLAKKTYNLIFEKK